MYNTIVVGTDGSATAGQAVRQAGALAVALGAKLHVVHAFQTLSAMTSIGPDGGAAAASIGLSEAVEAQAKAILDRAVEDAKALGVEVEAHLSPGDAANALIETAERVDADLLVIGNKGMSGVRRFVLGSVPNKVSHHCPCSLLIVNTTG
ncbi:MAG: universal stress protein [Acidimicrobiales bacterium]